MQSFVKSAGGPADDDDDMEVDPAVAELVKGALLDTTQGGGLLALENIFQTTASISQFVPAMRVHDFAAKVQIAVSSARAGGSLGDVCAGELRGKVQKSGGIKLHGVHEKSTQLNLCFFGKVLPVLTTATRATLSANLTVAVGSGKTEETTLDRYFKKKDGDAGTSCLPSLAIYPYTVVFASPLFTPAWCGRNLQPDADARLATLKAVFKEFIVTIEDLKFVIEVPCLVWNDAAFEGEDRFRKHCQAS